MASNQPRKDPSDMVPDGGDESLKRQGSLRRVLPPNGSGEPVVGMSAKMIERPRPSNFGVNSSKRDYNQFFQEYSLIAEYNLLVSHSLPGLYIIPAANSALVWFCVVFVRKGLYQGGVFRFNLLIPEEFPNCSCPRVLFESEVFHPSVDPISGEMELKSAFPEWRKDVNRLWQILDHVVQMFCSVDPKNALNSEAADLFERSQEEFIEKVNECVNVSQTTIYDPPTLDDPHYLKFDKFESGIHDKALEALIDYKEDKQRPTKQGLSWVQYGSLEPFSASHHS